MNVNKNCLFYRKYHGYHSIVIFFSYHIEVLIFQYHPALCTSFLITSFAGQLFALLPLNTTAIQDNYKRPGDDTYVYVYILLITRTLIWTMLQLVIAVRRRLIVLKQSGYWHSCVCAGNWTTHMALVTNLPDKKGNQIFSPVKIPYRMHSMLNTTGILHRIIQSRIIPTKPINDAIITASNILCEINYQKPHQLSFRHRQ